MAKINDKPVLFFAFANDHTGGENSFLRSLKLEEDGIREALSEGERSGLYELVIRTGVSLKRIVRVFQDPSYKNRIVLFHFAGHANAYSLVLESPFREQDLVYANGFASFLAEQKNLQLIFLNACATKAQGQLLLKLGLPAVLSTHSAIDDKIAGEMAIHFYKALGGGDNLTTAYRAATSIIQSQHQEGNNRALYREDMKELEELPWRLDLQEGNDFIAGWNLPELTNQPLYPLPLRGKFILPDDPWPGLCPYSSDLAPVFWGRDQEVRDLYDIIQTSSDVTVTLLYGSEGVGKRSLIQAGLIPRLPGHWQVHHSLDLDLAVLKADLNLVVDKEEVESADKYILCVCSDLREIDHSFIQQILKPAIQSGRKIHFLLSMPTEQFSTWSAGLKANNIKFNSFFLPQITEYGFRQIIEGVAATDELSQRFRTHVDEDVVLRLLSLFYHDSKSPILPLLQHTLTNLWERAKSVTQSTPDIQWFYYETLSKEGLWHRYVENALSKADKMANKSGLSLNILAQIIRQGGLLSLREVEETFSAAGQAQTIHDLVDRLKAERLICSPVSDNMADAEMLCLVHDILSIPVLDLINRSDRPGQTALRLLWSQEYDSDKSLSEKELLLVESAKDTLPKLSKEQNQLLQLSHKRLKKRKQKQLLAQALRVATVIVILAIPIFVNNPYLFSFLILVLVLYDSK